LEQSSPHAPCREAHYRLQSLGKFASVFWLSLIPFVTGWMGENHFATVPVALYGVALLCAACAYWVLQRSLIKAEGPDCLLARAVGGDWKGNLSPLIYAAGVALAFVRPWISCALYVVVAGIWLLPDPRIERKILPAERRPSAGQ